MFGLLGMNARNLIYTRKYNNKKAFGLSKDKAKTKKFLASRGIAVPKIYAHIKEFNDLKQIDIQSLPSEFVIKPNLGSGGEGIMLVHKNKKKFENHRGQRISSQQIHDHILDILDGRYSTTNMPDSVIIEQMVHNHESIDDMCYKGVADIRIIVFNYVPVMAMLRIPTQASEGKANLHLGGAGLGIDIATGTITHVMYQNRIVRNIPGTQINPRGRKLPHWDKTLEIASKTQVVSGLGFLGCDVVLDQE
ncbi:MAG: sugar-transfer associated ATP-grasp domain-containing protein [Patescibacteria group bacterium]|nr:sugar-transfer associated ATP-grasp domain-containing protein [Patescibacteria group bacterium]